ncbi:LysR family transcriptional regulator [Ureibacillus acetophenoni]|uniref:LysR family transcriptional repressor of citA n=1 Tax=Ureibacillus acetophenoni TaxID=614649 RepID=A0A285UKW0_9BACL|nr:LysR family transcriptional regulator [Ureibacillus acetophenoni]SOC42535.1 LysR family transcriptional repressor of citA [Ureibacillus acetophenoni]
MEIKWLKSFVTAVECGNFRLAAEKLYISQPSITVHIHQLEESLQISLYERNHTQLTLTDEGQYYYYLAKDILKKIEDSKRKLSLYSVQKRTLLKVAISPILVETNLPNILFQFTLRNPNFEIQIIVEDSKYMDEIILKDEVNLAIGIGTSKQTIIHSEKLCSSPMQLIYPKGQDSSTSKRLIQLEDLFERYPLFTGHLDEAVSFEAQLELHFPTMRKMNISQSYIVKQFVKDGLGMAFLPNFIVYQEAKNGLYNIFHFDRFLLPTIDLYIRHIKENEKITPLLETIRNSYNSIK